MCIRDRVKHASAYTRVETRIREACAGLRLDVRDYFASRVVGGDGNHEFFVWAQGPAPTPGEAR